MTENKDRKSLLLSFYSVILLLLFFVRFLACSTLWAETEAKTRARIVKQNEDQDNWFLLPTSRLEGYKKLGQVYLNLFAAPSLNLEAVFALAKKYEKKIEYWQYKQRYDLKRSLCLLKQNEFQERLGYLQKERKRQFLLWQAVHQNYARSVENYLEKRQALGKLEPSLLKLIQSSFKDLKEMQHQRQKQISGSWALLLRTWEAQAAKSSLFRKSCAAQSQSRPFRGFLQQEEASIKKEKQEARELIRPYYLALYRFLRLFPASERGPFLFQMHRPKFR